MTATTRRVDAALRDLEQIRRETEWLTRHLGDIEIIAHSPPHNDVETVHVHSSMTQSPALSETWQPILRENVRITIRLLRKIAVEVTTARVGLESTFGGPGAALEMLGTLLDDPGELDRARSAKARRDAHQGDYRWGEWEATPAK